MITRINFISSALLIATFIVLGTVENGQCAVVISRTSSSVNMDPVGGGARHVSIIPSNDKHHHKRQDNLLEPEPPVAPELDSNGPKRRTFTKNELRPCTFCRFFTTVTPAPKPKIYLNLVRH
uniref:Secreted protein n=1 Tax=Anopheles minimus TaxID=112268 RepID=A0A182W6C6_9DIPT